MSNRLASFIILIRQNYNIIEINIQMPKMYLYIKAEK
jgi:hypothetical protein